MYLNPIELSTINMVLMDEKGQKIHASINNHLKYEFAEQLVEGSVYYFTNFRVASNNGYYHMSRHPFKIKVLTNTTLLFCNEFDGCQHGFDFAKFDNILSKNYNFKFAVDIIAKVVSCSDLRLIVKDGEEIEKMCLELEDPEGLRIRCTLYAEFARRFSSYADGLDLKCEVVLILQSALLHDKKGLPVITASFSGTKMFINSDYEGIVVLRDRLMLKIAAVRPTQGSNQPSYCNYDFLRSCERKFVYDIKEIGKVSTCVVVATIDSVPTNQTWHYLACFFCNEPVRLEALYTDLDDLIQGTRDNNLWGCSKCLRKGVSIVPRFKLQVKVKDKTGCITFVLHDHEVSKILNLTAHDLCQLYPEDGIVDLFPDEFNELIHQKFVFNIEISSINIFRNYDLYRVLNLSNDEKIMSHLENLPLPYQVPFLSAKDKEETGNENDNTKAYSVHENIESIMEDEFGTTITTGNGNDNMVEDEHGTTI